MQTTRYSAAVAAASDSERILYMKFPFLASFIIFILVITRAIKRHTRLTEHQEKSFWAKEREANNVRRKSLDGLDYIQIPFDRLPVDTMKDHAGVQECLELLHSLSACKIVNFTGYTNTELKLQYGAANITPLSQYDQNYTLLVCTLQKWADILYQAGYRQEAGSILEFAVSTHTDVSKSYYTLAKIYQERNDVRQIDTLIQTAEKLHSLSGRTIVRTLRESYPCNG